MGDTIESKTENYIDFEKVSRKIIKDKNKNMKETRNLYKN